MTLRRGRGTSERDDRLPARVSFAHPAHRLGDLRELVALLDTGFTLPRLDQLTQRGEIVAVRLRDEERAPFAGRASRRA